MHATNQPIGDPSNPAQCLRRLMRIATVAFLPLFLGSAAAGTITVTQFNDVIDDNDGTCTLREAIRSANDDVAVDACSISGAAGDDRILLTAGTYSVDLANGRAGAAESRASARCPSSCRAR